MFFPFYFTLAANNFCNLLANINAASNFILYCALSDKYRKTVKAIFCGIRPIRKNTLSSSRFTSARTTTSSFYSRSHNSNFFNKNRFRSKQPKRFSITKEEYENLKHETERLKYPRLSTTSVTSKTSKASKASGRNSRTNSMVSFLRTKKNILDFRESRGCADEEETKKTIFRIFQSKIFRFRYLVDLFSLSLSFDVWHFLFVSFEKHVFSTQDVVMVEKIPLATFPFSVQSSGLAQTATTTSTDTTPTPAKSTQKNRLKNIHFALKPINGEAVSTFLFHFRFRLFFGFFFVSQHKQLKFHKLFSFDSIS